MLRAEVLQLLDEIQNLPTLPVVVQQLQKLIANPRTNMSQLAAVIAKDQAISSRVVRLVNSAFYGFQERITSIQHGIVILGLNTIKSLVIGVSVVRMFEDSAKTKSFDHQQFWLHTLACAMGAKLLAEELSRDNSEDYFLAGLLHDMGILVMEQYLHEHFNRALERSRNEALDFLKAEVAELGVTHGEVGEFLAGKWSLPEFLGHTIRYHHQPAGLPKDTEPSRDKIAVVHVCDARARKMGTGRFAVHFDGCYCMPALNYLKISEPVLDKIFAKVEPEVRSLAREWGL